MPHHRFSQAISEGDGISVIVVVEDADAARAAESQRAEALVVTRDPAAVRDATSLPILWRGEVPVEDVSAVADAYLLVFEAYEEGDRLEELYGLALEHGLDCIVDVQDEDELEQALDRIDPEIFLLSPRAVDRGETPLECVLALLPNVPAGKLAIADLPHTTRADVDELERAGVDAVIVGGRDVSDLVGGPPPQV